MTARARDGAATPNPPRALRVAMGAVAAVCVAVSVAHVTLVFLHVAPSNPVSQRYDRQIRGWISPLFEQNWMLFAPNPNATRTQIFARTGTMTADGGGEVSDWFDISAVDKADTRHNPYPSRTTQHMLRRAWDSYVATHGEDEISHDAWALTRQRYLRNIAVRRVAAHSSRPYQMIRLKSVTQWIAPPDTGGPAPTYSTEPYTRLLPWWNVTPDGS
ncbi:DUF5819 family protein [Actinoplanes sp. NEAU-A12]|uniref:DUF5819 family protein n=1 Tax=Actinoplanes sandaracinus TaxID=3045177 RepID=A0ABT6WBD2_9ACTN|nr:DUF5819 family protein [Actinoplanes sandaracinus]MDI6097021.1 DUF5819 family protein [Actinoplanes sandaracinus]